MHFGVSRRDRGERRLQHRADAQLADGPHQRLQALLLAQLFQIDEMIRLTAQFIGNHRRLAANGGDDRYPLALALQVIHQALDGRQ